MIEDHYLIDQLKQKKLKTLDQVYLTYKEEFFLFARSLSFPEEDISDLYHETIISFYENIQNGKLNNLTSTLKTYLFAIGKFKMYKAMESNKARISNDLIIHADEEVRTFEVDIDIEKQQVLKSAFTELGIKCKKVLELYYYEGLTLDEIQDYLGYSSKDVLKSQKSRCLRQLKEFVAKKYE